MFRVYSMLLRSLLLLFVLAVTQYTAIGQSRDGFPLNARAMGLGHATATIRDDYAMLANIAGISDLDGTYANFSYNNRFTTSALQTVGASVVHPFRTSGIGIMASRFGDEIYNEQHIALGYAHQIRAVSIGVKVNYAQINIAEFGTKGALSIDFGGIAPMAENLWFGAYMININQAKLAEYQDERSPTIMRAGLSYRPFDRLMINVEVEKDIELPASARAGIEYELVKKVRLRTGVSTRSFMGYFGVGFNTARMKIDYALSNHQDLGITQSISISYRIRDRKEDE